MHKKYCKYCWPTKRKNHFSLHFNYYIEKIIKVFFKPLEFLQKKKSKNHIDSYWPKFFALLTFIKIIKFEDEINEKNFHNRSLVFFKEAKKRGIDIKVGKIFGKYLNEYRFIYNKKKYYYEGIPLTVFDEAVIDFDQKDNCKIELEKNNLAIVQGKVFTKVLKASEYGKSIGFPLVVKPSNGSLSHHVVYPINNEEELLDAIKIAKMYSPAFIVEKYIQGNLFRASVIGRKHVFVCQKEKANVIGDGFSTIEELIKEKNANIYRGKIEKMNSTLHEIPINDVLLKNLKSQNLEFKTVLSKNKKIFLQDKFVLSHGCDVIACNNILHPKNKELFIKVAELFKTDLVGIDFICSDISKSYEEQESAIIEMNSLPYIDMHQNPSHGEAEPVAEIVWDIVLERLDNI